MTEATPTLPQIAGYQVVSSLTDECAFDRPSYEILPQDLALSELVAIRKETSDRPGQWNMIVILKDDIEEPTFVDA